MNYGRAIVLRNGQHICDWCGVFLHGRPHAVVLTVDGYVTKRVILCVTHRDELRRELEIAWDETALRSADANYAASMVRPLAP